MFLGNIVSKNKIKVNSLYNSVDDMNLIDPRVPTLIIGWDFVKSIFSEKKLSILDKDIGNDIYWTFSKFERRVDYEKDVEIFIHKTLNLVQKSVNYQYINVLTCDIKTVKKLIKILNFYKNSSIYVCKNSFVYACFGNQIYGIDLNSTDYLNIDRKKIYKLLFSNNNKVIFNDNFLPKIIKENTIGNNIIIPYLYSIIDDTDREQT